MQKTDVTNWGILGASKFAATYMAPAIHAAQGARLVAVASRNKEKIAPFQSFAPDIAAHDSYAALLADPRIDAVYIPLPNDLHVHWAIRALEAGKAALIEKPVAMSVAQLDTLVAARDRTGELAAEAFMIVHHPQWAKMQDLLASGALGQLRRVDGVFCYDNSADLANIRNTAVRGGGGMRDVGVYPIGAVRYATGLEPLRLTDIQITREAGVDVRAHVEAEFDGFSCGITASMRMMRWQHMQFHGSAGVARLTAPFNPGVFGEARLELHRPDFGTEVFRWPEGDQYVWQVEAFQRAMRGAAFAWPLEVSRGTQAVIDAALKA